MRKGIWSLCNRDKCVPPSETLSISSMSLHIHFLLGSLPSKQVPASSATGKRARFNYYRGLSSFDRSTYSTPFDMKWSVWREEKREQGNPKHTEETTFHSCQQRSSIALAMQRSWVWFSKITHTDKNRLSWECVLTIPRTKIQPDVHKVRTA